MRLNKYLALATGMSRRAADAVIAKGRVQLNDKPAITGQQVQPDDNVTLDGHQVTPKDARTTIILNKPVGYICSRKGQGGRTIYDLLPQKYHKLKPVGRLDKDSSGLLLMTNDGDLAHKLTHPSFNKNKVYEIELDKALSPEDRQHIAKVGVKLEDGISKFGLDPLENETKWLAILHEGRNRQIRRTFGFLGYQVKILHRLKFGEYELEDLEPGKTRAS